MPYLGNVPAESYSQVSYQDLTGGSGTSFTLDYPVGSAGEIEVFVNNVRQEPTVAYTVNGTALTMTGSVAATDDFYIVFQGKAEKSGTIPEKQANGDYNFDNNTLFIDSSANSVGVGTASPSSVLDVEVDQDAETNIELTNTNTGSSAQVRTKYTTDGGLFTVGKTSDAHAFGGDAYLYNVDNTNIRFATSDTERMRITSAGGIEIPNQNAINEITFTGTEFTNVLSSSTSGFQLGTTGAGYLSFLTSNTERIRIDSDGLKFNGDTAAANALSDYEEGSGSSVTISGSSSGSATVPATMYYVKIGDIVNVSIQITNQTFPTFSGDLRCSLPFTCKSGTVARGGDCYWYPPSAWDTQTNFVGVIPQTVGTLAYAIFPDIKVDSDRQTNIGSSNSSLSGASGVYLNFSLTYQTA